MRLTRVVRAHCVCVCVWQTWTFPGVASAIWIKLSHYRAAVVAVELVGPTTFGLQSCSVPLALALARSLSVGRQSKPSGACR